MQCAGFPLQGLLLQSMGSWSHEPAAPGSSAQTGSIVVACGPSCSVACGIFLDQGWNPCLLHWQAPKCTVLLPHRTHPSRGCILKSHSITHPAQRPGILLDYQCPLAGPDMTPSSAETCKWKGALSIPQPAHAPLCSTDKAIS